MTPKQRVLKKYPKAWCAYTGVGRRVIVNDDKDISVDTYRTANAAWADADRRIAARAEKGRSQT